MTKELEAGPRTLVAERLKALLTELLADKEGRRPVVSIHTWNGRGRPEIGFRVADISAWWPDGSYGSAFGHGLSFTQVDLESAAVILASERLALAWLLDEDIGDVDRCVAQLTELLTVHGVCGHRYWLEPTAPVGMLPAEPVGARAADRRA